MPDHDPTQLVFGPVAMEHDVEGDQDPRQPGRLEIEHAKEAQPDVRVATAPDVHERGAERGAEEGLVEERRDGEKRCAGVREQVGEMRDGRGGFFKHTSVALDEEDVEEQVEGKRAEVDEGGDEAPVLTRGKTDLALDEDGTETVEQLERREDLALDQDACIMWVSKNPYRQPSSSVPVTIVAVVHQRVHTGISMNHCSSGMPSPPPIMAAIVKGGAGVCWEGPRRPCTGKLE
nr:hypothetical protein CFP56_33589 [Quercus suber]